MIFSRFARHRNLNAGPLLDRADAARDARNWSAARQLYEQHLAFSAADAPIWVQLGHTRKESGDLTGAEVAYREGLKLAADDADAHLQLGHVLKLMGRREEATASYRQAVELDRFSRARNGLGDSLKTAKRDRSARHAGRPALSGDVVANLRGQGDRAHAVEEWAQAAAYYRDYLEAVPDDIEIWIQLGHVAKQMKDFAAAERAYRKATSLAPKHVDAMLSLSRFLVDSGRNEEGQSLQKQAFALEPSFEHYQSRIADEPVEITAEPHQVKNGLVLDISDLLSYLHNGGTITGIQRVQIGVISPFLTGGVDMSFDRWDVVFATPIDCCVWRLQPQDIWRLIDYCTAQQANVMVARNLIEDIRRRTTLLVPSKGSAYVILGAFWGGTNLASFCRSLQSMGVRVGPLIHDLFPITHPEFVGDGVIEDFNADFVRGIACWDFILTNSAFTAAEVQQYIGAHGGRRLPIVAVPLSHRLDARADGPTPKQRSVPTEAIQDLKDRPFVLTVGTIEARKNHNALFHVWRMLKQSETEVPPLVLVGKRGWRVENLMEQLRLSGLLGREVRVIENASDALLSHLYATCLFTVFPSFAEGWGIPVGEALDHGKVVVASETSAMREVGGEFALYVDPYNVRAQYELISKLIKQPSYLRELENKIERGFRPRLWRDVARDLAAAVIQISKGGGTPPRPLPKLLAIGEELDLEPVRTGSGSGAQPIADQLELELVLASGWSRRETHQTWLESRMGTIALRTNRPCGAQVRVLMLLVSPPWARGNTVELRTASDRSNLAVPSGVPFVTSVNALVGAGGLVETQLSLVGPTTPVEPETRPIRVGLCAIALAEPTTPKMPRLAALQRHDLGFVGDLRRDWLSLERSHSVFIDGWLPQTGVGAPIEGHRARLAFETEGRPGQTVRVLLEFQAEANEGGASLRLIVRGRNPQTFAVPQTGGPFRGWSDFTIPADRLAEISVGLGSDLAGQLPRTVLTALRYSTIDTLEDRIGLIEAMLLPETVPAEQMAAGHVLAEAHHWPDPLRRLHGWLRQATIAPQ